MDSFLEAIGKYADFSGRARRKEYWMFALFVFVIYIGLILAGGLLAGVVNHASHGVGGLVFLAPAYLFILAMFIPSLSVSARRLHDTGRSGWWILIGMVPFVGGIVLLVFHCQDSQMGPNEYGPNPKGIGALNPYPPFPQAPPAY
jgi:uncharacterized membrane protein YhaH (DUF805 family)